MSIVYRANRANDGDCEWCLTKYSTNFRLTGKSNAQPHSRIFICFGISHSRYYSTYFPMTLTSNTHTHYHTENVFRKRFLHSVNRKSVEYLLIELD